MLIRRATESRSPWAGLTTVAALLLVAACVAVPPGSVGPAARSAPAPSDGAVTLTASPGPEPCPPVPSTAPPAEPLPPGLDDATRVAIEKRTEYGLRRDLVWVRQVAADRRAVMDFGVPMLPEETESLFARNELGRPVRAALGSYGHGDQFGGLYIDNALGGVVVLLWTADVAVHEAAIRPLLPRCHPVLFRQVRWSEAELRQWQDRISADWDWFAAIPAAPQGVGVDITANVVSVEISSAKPTAAEMILAHYRAPPGMIRVDSDGTGAALLPWGTVKGLVVTVDGKAPGNNNLLIQEGSGGPPGSCGGGDIGFGVQANGKFEYPCQAGVRIIQVIGIGNVEPHPVLGEVRVDVPAGGVVVVRIVIDRHP